MCTSSQAKFCPKKPVTKVSGRKTVASFVSCSMLAFWRTLILVCSTEITAMLASSTVPSRSRCAATSGPLRIVGKFRRSVRMLTNTAFAPVALTLSMIWE